MNSDEGFVIEYSDVLTPQKQAKVRALLADVDNSTFDRFIEAVRYPVSTLYAHSHAHGTFPDAKDQQRFLTKLTNKTDQLLRLSSEVSELLDETPFGFRNRATNAKVPIHLVQANLTNMMMAINDIAFKKSKYRPEVEKVVKEIATAFHKELCVEPVVLAFREADDIPSNSPVGERFVPVLAALMNRSVDHAYRLANEILPS